MGGMSELTTPPAPDDSRALPIKGLRSAARSAFKSNLAICAVVSMLSVTFIWPIMSPSALVSTSYDSLRTIFELIHLPQGEAVLAWLRSAIAALQRWTSVGSDASAGVISSLYDSAKTSGSLANALVYALNHALFRGSLSSSIIAALAFLVALAAALFIQSPLRLSSLRFYLETRIYPATSLSRLLFVFRRRRTIAIGLAMLYKIAWLALWVLTIVMFPVKYYSYLLYDYILAENPETSPRAALKLSEEMMRGKRWRAFLLDLSFLPWYLLGLLSFGLVIYLYASPYRNLAVVELYSRARADYLSRPDSDTLFLTDPYLATPPSVDELLDKEVPVSAIETVSPSAATLLAEGFTAGKLPVVSYPDLASLRARDRMRYQRDYSWGNLVLLFFAFSIIGWAYESVIAFAYVGHFVNRGTMYGPWLPIYGCGGVATLLALKKIRDRPVLTFFSAMAICGVIEYIAATVVQKVTGLEYWSYQGYFFNIQGRVCLEGLLVFGFACCAVIYFLAPLLDSWINRIPVKVRLWIMIGLTVCFLTDLGLAACFPRTGDGLTSGI